MSLSLTVQPRTKIGKVVDTLRRDRQIPAVLYGHHIDSQPVSIDAGAFDAVYKQAGSSSLIDVQVDQAQPVKALIHAIQRHPTTGRVIHVDLYQVRMTEKLEAEIELNFVGESPAVKELGGILVKALDNVRVSCLPADLVSEITVDISTLATFEDRIHVNDIAVPAGITILDKGDEVVASVTPPRSEAEIASLSDKVEENVESVESSKKAPAADEEAESESSETTTQ